MMLQPGTRLGLYQVVASIGAGGMGEVYRARDTTLNRDVAIKILPPSMSTDPVAVEAFKREGRTAAALSHPNIVTIDSVEEADGIPFLTMEFIEGLTLAKRIPPGGLSLDEFLDIATPVADALAAAHERGIVHRDLKPSNLMIDP